MTLDFLRSEFYRFVWLPRYQAEMELTDINAMRQIEAHVRLQWLDRRAALRAIEEAWLMEWLNPPERDRRSDYEDLIELDAEFSTSNNIGRMKSRTVSVNTPALFLCHNQGVVIPEDMYAGIEESPSLDEALATQDPDDTSTEDTAAPAGRSTDGDDDEKVRLRKEVGARGPAR